MIALVRSARTGQIFRKCAGSPVGLPSSPVLAWRWRIAAPASAASTALSTIWDGVMGRYSDVVGVWTEPVIAQETMILRFFFGIVGLGRINDQTIIKTRRQDTTGSRRTFLWRFLTPHPHNAVIWRC